MYCCFLLKIAFRTLNTSFRESIYCCYLLKIATMRTQLTQGFLLNFHNMQSNLQERAKQILSLRDNVEDILNLNKFLSKMSAWKNWDKSRKTNTFNYILYYLDHDYCTWLIDNLLVLRITYLGTFEGLFKAFCT